MAGLTGIPHSWVRILHFTLVSSATESSISYDIFVSLLYSMCHQLMKAVPVSDTTEKLNVSRLVNRLTDIPDNLRGGGGLGKASGLGGATPRIITTPLLRIRSSKSVIFFITRLCIAFLHRRQFDKDV
ncbi:hypothetical protein PUN28_005361 [Cardiocondyla obscurior]|uniref:Uncharacterized protein n=1 Tax=Cardiocondyla obscurior TaxID=286306 RepID=A0AAW2GKM1_9HYME